MESIETGDALARLAQTLRAPTAASAELQIARQLLANAAASQSTKTVEASSAAYSVVSSRVPASAGTEAGKRVSDALLAAMHGPSLLAPDALQQEIVPKTAGAFPQAANELGDLASYDFAVRRIPVRAPSILMSTPAQVAGRSLVRTLGPFLDPAGQFVWIDLFLRVHETPVVRAPGTEPSLLIPLRGLLLASATEYVLPAGSVWILARLLAPTAPAGGYCGIRIKGGRLKLSSHATIAGGTIQIGAGVVATLEVETQPAAAPAGAAALGLEGDASRCEPPAKARFVFNVAGGRLDAVDDCKLAAYGTALTFKHLAGGVGRIEPLVNRVWLPLAATSGKPFRIQRPPLSELFQPAADAAVKEGGWALSITTPASSAALGPAEGAGGVAARLDPGLLAKWRGVTGGPVRLGQTVILTEPGRLTLATARESEARAFQTLRLWQEANTGPGQVSQATLGFALPGPLTFFSEAGVGDVLQVEASIECSFDRPIGVDGARFPLRGNASALLSQSAGGFQAQILADVTPPASGLPYSGPGSLALSNGLLRVTPPAGVLISGSWQTPERVQAGLAAVLFGLRAIVPALKDPYVTNYTLPFRRDLSGESIAAVSTAASSAAAAGLLIALVRWPAPEKPELEFFLSPASPSYAGLLGALPAEADTGSAPSGALGESITKTVEDDAAADRALRRLFERTAQSVQEGLFLLDVSSNIDQFGIGFGLGGRGEPQVSAPGFSPPLQIAGMDLSAPGRNLRILLLPQFQWEPVMNQFNPLVGPFPDRLASADDGGRTVLGTPSITLVPIAPERLAATMLAEFNIGTAGTPLAAKFTLPFGMKAVARFQPDNGLATQWATLDFNRPTTADGRLTGGLQIRAQSQPDQGPESESPSFPGAAWQTRNGIDPVSGTPFGMSVLSATFGNPGVEKFFNDEMGPSGSRPRVPVKRIEFSGYGASAFSAWANPNAVAATSQVRFDVFVGRTAYEVVQVASFLIPWAVPVVRTITLERKKEGTVLRFDSGWVATGPGLYRYPPPDPAVVKPAGWTPIETHPGVVRGAWNVRRIRETNRVITRSFPSETVELLEVRFDADFDIENVVKGAGTNGLVPSRDQIGYVQRAPQGYPLLPEHLAAILDSEGPVGGQMDCIVDIAHSGQRLHVTRVDVAPAPAAFGAPSHFAASARGALALPNDGQWSAVRHDLSAAEPQAADAHTGVPLVRAGTASGSIAPSPSYRIAEPADVLREDSPTVEYGLIQGSEAHRVLFPRPRILAGTTQWSSTERAALADTYTLSLGVGMFPAQKDCLVGETPWGLSVDGTNGRFTLLPAPTMRFMAPPPVADRRVVDTAPFKIRTRYESDMRFTLDPTVAQPWAVEADSIFTTMDLGPFSELLGVRHGYRVGAGEPPAFVRPQTIYPPPLQPVVEVLEFLASLLGIDNALGVEGHQGSYNFKASLTLNIVNPRTKDGFIDFGGFEVKGKLAIGIASAPRWNGFLKLALGTRVPVLPPIFGGGEIGVELEGTALAEQKVQIEVKWSASVGKRLGPVEVKAVFTFGIQVITSNTGSWQIGLLIGIAGTADVWIVKIAIRVELLAAIKVLTAAEAPPSGAKKAIGQAKLAADVTIAVFVTITVEFTIQVEEDLHF